MTAAGHGCDHQRHSGASRMPGEGPYPDRSEGVLAGYGGGQGGPGASRPGARRTSWPTGISPSTRWLRRRPSSPPASPITRRSSRIWPRRKISPRQPWFWRLADPVVVSAGRSSGTPTCLTAASAPTSASAGHLSKDGFVKYVKFGGTGMDVSRICLGCMSYGDRRPGRSQWVLDEEESRPFIRTALEPGINFFDTANVYSGGSSEEFLGRALRDFANRDEVVIATKVHGQIAAGPQRRRFVPQGHHDGDRSQPPPAGDRLRRPVPDPSVRSPHSAGGDAGGAARRRQGGQGPLPRGFVHVRLAVRHRPLHVGGPRVGPVRQHAGPLQPPQSRGGAGDAPALRRPGGRR